LAGVALLMGQQLAFGIEERKQKKKTNLLALQNAG
jgi:hypothetical protein